MPLSEHYSVKIPDDKFAKAKLLSSRLKLLDYCSTFLQPNPVIAEVGVAEGWYSEKLLSVLNPETCYLIDTYQHTSVYSIYSASSHYPYILKKFKDIPKVKIIKNLSWDGLSTLEDNSLDYIYIDADHSYSSVKKDIEVAYRKVKSGGIIHFNDYTVFSVYENIHYGVSLAVNEFLEQCTPEIIGLSLDFKGYQDIAVRVIKD